MSLDSLLKAGAFISEGVTSRQVQWEGHTFDVLIKNEMSAADFEFIYGAGGKADINPQDEAYSARRVHRFVLMADTRELIPYEKAVLLKPSLLLALCEQINLLHGAEVVKKKTSPMKTSSGANSRSRSAARLPKPKSA